MASRTGVNDSRTGVYSYVYDSRAGVEVQTSISLMPKKTWSLGLFPSARRNKRYIYADSESVGAVVETPKLLEVLMDKGGPGLRGANGVSHALADNIVCACLCLRGGGGYLTVARHHIYIYIFHPLTDG